jgi:glutamate:Na+ symporter, ESS family
MMKLDLIQTLAFAGAILFVGYGIRKFVGPLKRYNIPAPVIGGLLVAIVITVMRNDDGSSLMTFDTTLQSPLMVAFFTSIGFGCSACWPAR